MEGVLTYTFMEGVHCCCMYILHFWLLHASFLNKFWYLKVDIFLNYWEVAMIFALYK